MYLASCTAVMSWATGGQEHLYENCYFGENDAFVGGAIHYMGAGAPFLSLTKASKQSLWICLTGLLLKVQWRHAGGDLQLKQALFEGNMAYSRGGAVEYAATGHFSAHESVFASNYVLSPNPDTTVPPPHPPTRTRVAS